MDRALRRIGLHGEFFDGEAGEAEGLAEGGGGLFEVEDALGVGQLVDAVDGGAVRFEPVGDALVGGEHELFDEAVGPAALGADDGGHVALGVEGDDGFGEVEVDGAAALAFAVEEEGELVHLLEGGDEVDVARRGFRGRPSRIA